MYSFMLVLVIVMILVIISLSFGKKYEKEREKSSPFECGFDPLGFGRVSFSMRFFLIAMIFLIFDVEIALLLPLVVTKLSSIFSTWLMLGMGFLFILIMGVTFEWKEGALDWKS